MRRLINKIIKWTLKRVLIVRINIFIWIALTLTILLVLWSSSGCDVHDKHNTNPVILWWTNGFPGTSETKTCSNGYQCRVVSDRELVRKLEVDAYLFYGSEINFDSLPLPRTPDGIIWGLYHEESPRNVEELLHEPTLSLFNFSSTFSRYSDVPLTLQYLSSLQDLTSVEYFVGTAEKNSLLNDLSPILYLQSDCETSTERDNYVRSLMKHINIDSYGTCLNNKQLPKKFQGDYLNNLNENEFLMFTARYKFVIAIENGVCEDYITEKLWRALRVGSVPIYFGSPSIEDWLPNHKSAILLRDFKTVEEMSRHLEGLMKNDTLYEEYLVHKTKRVVSNRRLIEEFNRRPWSTETLETTGQFECLVCEKLHDRRRGGGGLAVHVVNRSHYDCPKPLSALTLSVNPVNSWVFSWETARLKSENLYKKIILESS